MQVTGEGDGAPLGVMDPFRALAETTPDAILTADAEHRVVFMNPAAERLLGYSAQELVGQSVGIIVPEEQRPAHEAGFSRFVLTGEAHLVGMTVAVDALRADGTRVPVELSLGVVGGGAEITVTAVIRDVSERVRAQRHVAAQLAVTEILTGPDEPGQEARIVQELTAVLGWDIGALWLVEGEHMRVSELWQADPAATVSFAEASRAATFRRGEGGPGMAWESIAPVWMEEAQRAGNFPRADAAAASGLATGVLLPLVTEGSVIGVLELYTRTLEPLNETLRDALATVASQIGESLRRQQHAADLARSNAELEQFAHVVAHDLSEPLRTISGFAELLERRAADDLEPDETQFLTAIVTSARRGQQILDSVLHLARLGTAEIDPLPINLDVVVSEALVGLRAMIEANEAVVDVDPLPTVSGDATQLGQVFQNLVANAVKFRAEAAPHVRISAREREGSWLIEVADNGRGIEPEHPVFGMFERTGTPDEVGLGIGLAVCQTVVERHGGSIWFESTLGQGTTFFLTVPA
ncbi:MAG: ATP-binding protein [Solirubrobacteraceae bacterium]